MIFILVITLGVPRGRGHRWRWLLRRAGETNLAQRPIYIYIYIYDQHIYIYIYIIHIYTYIYIYIIHIYIYIYIYIYSEDRIYAPPPPRGGGVWKLLFRFWYTRSLENHFQEVVVYRISLSSDPIVSAAR